MSDEQEWDRRVARERTRFSYINYTIKDHYYDPDAPYFCSGWYLAGRELAKVVLPAKTSSGGFDGEHGTS